jgi:uncharacterized protein
LDASKAEAEPETQATRDAEAPMMSKAQNVRAAKAKVYFVPLKEQATPEEMAAAAVRLWGAMNLDTIVAKGALVALKQHFGEKGSKYFVPAAVAKAVGERVRQAGGKPFSTDSNTLYNGMRCNAVDHLELAREHGFSHDKLGFPVIIADGLKGESQVTLEGHGEALQHVFLAGAGYMADSAIMLTHVTGHLAAGIGAAIKNVAMGFAGRAGKLQQHHSAQPIFTQSKCKACGRCAKHCPTGAILVKNEAAEIDLKQCIGCGECYAFCPHGAVSFEWSTTSPDLQRKMAEYCLAFQKEKAGHVAYFNFMTRVTKNCDCLAKNEECLPDLGLLGSTDIVAVDVATADLLSKKHGRDVFAEYWPECDHRIQLEYGEKIGLGSTKYDLVQVD